MAQQDLYEGAKQAAAQIAPVLPKGT